MYVYSNYLIFAFFSWTALFYFQLYHPEYNPITFPVSQRKNFSTVSHQLFSLKVNVYGWLHGDFGGGRTARTIIRSLIANNISVVGVSISGAELHSNTNNWVDERKLLGNPRNGSIDILVINAINTEKALLEQRSYFGTESDYRIGYWHWETSHLPPNHGLLGEYYDEIWVPSHFIADAIRSTATFPPETKLQIIPYGYEDTISSKLIINKKFARQLLIEQLSGIYNDAKP